MVLPPSPNSPLPVIPELSLDTRNSTAAATRSGRSRRPSGAVESIRHGSDSPIGRIRAQLVKVAVAHGEAQAPPSLFTKAAAELSARDPEVASTVAAAFETMRAHYAACIVEAQQAGEIADTADADSLGAYFCAVIEGMGTLGGTGAPRATLLDIGFTSLAAVPVTDLGRSHLGTDDGDWS